MSILFFAFILLMPHTKFSIPALGKYELTFSDFSILLFLFLNVLMRKRLSKPLRKYLYVFLFFLFTMAVTIFVATSYWKWLLGMLPYFFALIIVLGLSFFFSSDGNKIKSFRIIWYCLIATLIFSAVPVYYQILTGSKNMLFWDRVGWRYTFLSQNPNQYGVYFVLYIFLITLLSLRYFKKSLKYILLLMIFMLPAVLFSGSRTAVLSTAVVVSMLLFILFIESSSVQKLLVTPIIFIAMIFAIQYVLVFTSNQGGQIRRALSIFDKIESKGLAGAAKVEGATGVTQVEGWEIYKLNPILGIGLNNKTIVYEGIKNEIHNTYLKILADAGTVGFIGFMLVFFFPLICIFFSRASFIFKLIALASFGLFSLMNIPHTLIRQRWVWVFMFLLFIMSQYDKNGNKEKSFLSVLK
jgi:O-antigen ligase